MRPFGVEQELLVALRTRTGDAWGMLGLYREQGQPLFDADELRFLRDIAPYLAEGARRGLLVGEATDPDARRLLDWWSCGRIGASSPHTWRRTLAR